jgi:hypothetical protein
MGCDLPYVMLVFFCSMELYNEARTCDELDNVFCGSFVIIFIDTRNVNKCQSLVIGRWQASINETDYL